MAHGSRGQDRPLYRVVRSRKILGLLAVGLLAGSMGAHAFGSLNDDSVDCSYFGVARSCSPPSATVVGGFEFTIGSPGQVRLLSVDVGASTVFST